jgi:ABC transport system ATP-binding/permease protein
METTILAVEQEAESLEALLHNPEFQAKRFAEIPEIVGKLDAAKAKAASLYSRWEELEAIREASGV